MLQKNKKSLQLSELERDAMRAAGRFNGQLMDYIRPFVKEGVTTLEIDRLVHDYTLAHKHRPATLNYMGYRHSCCTSVNDVICHGIPGKYALRYGDIVNVDITSVVDGWHGDQSETLFVGEVSREARAVVQCAFDCLHLAIGAIRPGCRVADIGETILSEATRRGFSVVREYVGHGLGRQFHQDPSIFHFPNHEGRQERLLPGTCFTIEPMINVGSRFTVLDVADGWTVRTRDGKLSAQFEHTILMTEYGPEVLTTTCHGPNPGHSF